MIERHWIYHFYLYYLTFCTGNLHWLLVQLTQLCSQFLTMKKIFNHLTFSVQFTLQSEWVTCLLVTLFRSLNPKVQSYPFTIMASQPLPFSMRRHAHLIKHGPALGSMGLPGTFSPFWLEHVSISPSRVWLNFVQVSSP